MHTEFWSVKLQGRDTLRDLVIDGVILKWNFEKYGVKVWSGFNWLTILFGNVLL
jgi:hypothetical protein